ncbi:glycoside hydrolase family protein [Ochrovirga pacifica]|uniref:glycoside hydrolase family protein n=1 Tax=Ochrovirga pacifica TaxID=1042376 RepID=UPI000255A26E|nr:glycoside hydrolase family protein [Ochrovirga pacifica]
MKSIVKTIAIAALLVACGAKKEKEAEKKDSTKVEHYKIEFGKVAKSAVFKEEGLSVWGGSLVKGEDGLYHMFYSRWPKDIGWEWVNYSEIAHATAPTPYGPFTFKDVALADRGRQFWDGSTTHNPTILKIKGKYYLYYMGNTGDKKIVSVPGKQKINWQHRNNQRIGVAVADSPNGPWTRMDKPVLDINHTDENAHDALMTSNPSVCEMADGKILMVYKAVGKKFKLPAGGPVVHMVAIADSPTGPFKKFPDPVFVFEGERFPAEDPYIWYQDGKYRAIVKRIKFEGKKRIFSLVHYDSEDGISWNKGKYFDISDRTVTWEDGTTTKFDHLERPQVYRENGEPVALLCAADTIDANNVRHSFNIQIPLKITKE